MEYKVSDGDRSILENDQCFEIGERKIGKRIETIINGKRKRKAKE